MKHLAVSLLASAAMMIAPAQAGELWLTIDQVRAYDMPAPVGSIVVGNPSIADVTVQSNQKILLYGKAPGLTNIYFFDADGKKMDNVYVRVQSDMRNMLVVHKGTARTTYSCTKNCEISVTIGDDPESFGAAASQAQEKIQSIIAGASGS